MWTKQVIIGKCSGCSTDWISTDYFRHTLQHDSCTRKHKNGLLYGQQTTQLRLWGEVRRRICQKGNHMAHYKIVQNARSFVTVEQTWIKTAPLLQWAPRPKRTWSSGGKAPLITRLRATWRWSASGLGRFTPRRMDGPKIRFWCRDNQKNHLHLPGNKPRFHGCTPHLPNNVSAFWEARICFLTQGFWGKTLTQNITNRPQHDGPTFWFVPL